MAIYFAILKVSQLVIWNYMGGVIKQKKAGWILPRPSNVPSPLKVKKDQSIEEHRFAQHVAHLWLVLVRIVQLRHIHPFQPLHDRA